METTVSQIALKDIAEYMRTHNFKIMDEHGDVWVITATKINTKKQRRLNKELGITVINYTHKAMCRKSSVGK